MKSLLNTINRAILLYQIRSLEITICGQNECLACVGDRLMQGRIIIARGLARKELARVRSEYNATFPPGEKCDVGHGMTQWQDDREEDFNSMAMLSSAIVFSAVIVLAVLIFK